MGRIVVTEFLTLDGRMSGPGNDQSWVTETFDGDMDEETLAQQRTVDLILLGRVTYQELAGYWPTVRTDHPEITRHMNDTPKAVVSTTLDRAPWGDHAPARVLTDLRRETVAAVKREVAGDIAVIGSASVVAELAALDLVDEYKLMLHPVVLGAGAPLFENLDRRRFTHTRTRALANGVVVLHYAA
ncbi:dihydrofolate reductase family protein [Actinoalloteichus caeruleus]|uniref:Dihydrofolate reductase n=1 Tax=Actinoalloteichus caeruleus DSM 43889 TaxID=1120930 RepID=A0ABT1JCS9_ACTCY|nr:dihydrofolate reductase family protein [Actinoalloteichus caeruleus]MCP2330294.1 Dihydrofolate reductase [Actinoalloteichus caeruleus DSM 43889]